MVTKTVLRVFLVSLTCIFQFSTQDPCQSGPDELVVYNGTLSSPNYPGNYPNDAYCQWRIHSTEEVVRLVFTFFETEQSNSSGIIKMDVLNTYDDYNRSRNGWLTFYGNFSSQQELEELIATTTQPYMYIIFESDNDTAYRGFAAEFTSITVCNSNPVEFQNIYNGVFATPGFPNNYANNQCVRWLIESTNDFVSLVFTTFDLENHYDYVYIYDGPTRDSPLIARLTGFMNESNNFTSTQEYMLVRFVSDSSNNATGFEAMFTSVQAPISCGSGPSLSFSYNGSLMSPNYPRNYPDDCIYKWLISSTEELVYLEFTFFSTQDFNDTYGDFVRIYDDFQVSRYLINSFAGFINQTTLRTQDYTSRTSQKVMYVTFESDDSGNDQGFVGYYRSVTACVSNPVPLSGVEGTFISPNYPNDYSNDLCVRWLITSSYGEYGLVQITFTHMDTEDTYDFVYVYDGSTFDDSLLARLTGNDTGPSNITSSQQYLLVKFISDYSKNSTGFEAHYISLRGDVEETPSTAVPELPTFLQCWKGKVFKKNKAYCRQKLCGKAKPYRIQRRRLCRRRRVGSINQIKLMQSRA